MSHRSQSFNCSICKNRLRSAEEGIVCKVNKDFSPLEEICNNFINDDYSKEIRKKNLSSKEFKERYPEVYAEYLKDQNIFGVAVICLLAVICVSIVWSLINVAFEIRSSYLSILIGIIAGSTVKYFGKGVHSAYGILSVIITFIGFFIGNLFCIAGLQSITGNQGFISCLFGIEKTLFSQFLIENIKPHDLIFYTISLILSYLISIRKFNEKEIRKYRDNRFMPES